MKKPDQKANPKEEKKAKDTKATTTTTKEAPKKTDKKEEKKETTAVTKEDKNKVITKKTGTETKINIHKKDDVKKEEDDDTKKHPPKQAKTIQETDKKDFGSVNDDAVSVSGGDTSLQETANSSMSKFPPSQFETNNDPKNFTTNTTVTPVVFDSKESLAQKEKEISQLKQAMNEKKQVQDELNKLIKENSQLKKEKADLIMTKEQLEKDNEMFSNELSTLLEDNEKLVKTNLDLTSKINDLEEKAKSFQSLEQELENLKIDLEIKNEECEGYKLELLNSKNNDLMSLDPDSEKARILELEQNVRATENALIKLDEQKNAEIYRLQKELKEKTERAKNADILPKKEEEIKMLNVKLEELVNANLELREQLNIFSGASMMMDGLISEKLQLEVELEKERREKESLKHDIDTTEQLLQEYEDSQKMFQNFIQDKENNIIELNTTINKLKGVIEEFGKKEENLIKSYNQIKSENSILRDEVKNSSNQNVNVDQILNKNSNIFSRLKTYMRRSVIEKLLSTDFTLQKFKYVVISEMIPKQVLDKGGYDSFDRYLLLVSIRKKVYCLIFNIIENDLIKEETTDQSDKTLAQENSKYLNFLKNLLNTLVDLNSLCLSLEVLFAGFSKDNFKTLSKAPLWNNIIAVSKIIENLADTMKNDTFSIKFGFEPIRTIIKVIQEEVRTNLKINMEEDNNPICLYNSQILRFLSQIIISYNIERESYPGAAKVVNGLYNQVKKTLKKIDEKFVFNFSFQNQVFELENNYYLKFIESSKILFDGTYEGTSNKYETLTEPLNKVCIIVMNYMEKIEKDEQTKESENKLPLNAWVELCLEVKNELIESVQTKEKLDNCLSKLDEIKIEKMQLESKIEENSRNKMNNDKKLAEALLVAGKVPQLEEQINEFKKKIEKYNTTIDSLREQLEVESSKAKNLQQKVDNSTPSIIKNPADKGGRVRNIPLNPGEIARIGISSGNLMTDNLPLLNTICDLQKERKFLKSKLMKEKLEDLLNENSFINRYIDKVSKLHYQEEKEKLLKVENEMETLNKNYKGVRIKMCSPKILDVTDKNYNYQKHAEKQQNKIAKMRADYLKNVDTIMFNLFGDNSLDKTFKEVIDNDITKTLKYISEKKLLVGKISFGVTDQSTANKVPVYLSETSLKLLNKTFLN